MPFVSDKVVVVTGASSGIGARLSSILREQGAKLALTARNAEKLAPLAGDDILVAPGDLTDEVHRRRFIDETAARFGRIDILINNAGRGSYYPALDQPLDDARAMFELNVFAPMHLTQLALPWLRESRGTVVNLSSIAGQINLPWLPLYSASKFALTSLSASQRKELHAHGIHHLTVYPGYVETGFDVGASGTKPPSGTMKGRMFTASLEQCCNAIVKGIESRGTTVVTPRIGWALLWLHRIGLV